MKKKIAVVAICILLVSLVSILGGIFNVHSIKVVFLDKNENMSTSDVLAQSGLELRSSILNINEKTIKAKISKAYPDRSVVPYDIERVFPNNVIIKVKGNSPLFCIKSIDGKTFLTDLDFQLSKEVQELTEDNEYIHIKNFELGKDASFNGKKELLTIHYAVKSLLEYWSIDALRSILSDITIANDDVKIATKAGDIFEVKILSSYKYEDLSDKEKSAIKDKMKSGYDKYILNHYGD